MLPPFSAPRIVLPKAPAFILIDYCCKSRRLNACFITSITDIITSATDCLREGINVEYLSFRTLYQPTAYRG